MSNLLQMLENQNMQVKKEFMQNIVSKGKVLQNEEIDIFKDEGIMLIEETIPYIENIYKNANRIIINEEEIVKIELAKKITVESVKHLSKHTNFIQNVNEMGEVEPSKILNINKEESYNTYENKLIYFLVKNILIYIKQKKDYLEKILAISNNIKDKKLEYAANTNVDGIEMFVNLRIDIFLNSKGIKRKIKEEISKIADIEEKLTILTNFEIFKLFEKKRVQPIIAPIKKTNLILKNVNFQYAVKLFEFLQQNLIEVKRNKQNLIDIEEKTSLKKMLDEMTLLYFMVIEKEVNEQKENELNELKKKFLNSTLEFLNLPEKEVEKVLIEKKQKDNLDSSNIQKEIRNVFDKYIHNYLNKIKK